MGAPELQQLLFVRADGQVVSAVPPKKTTPHAQVESAAPPAEEPAR